jgi:transposase
VHVEGRNARAFCERCGIAAPVKERPVVSIIDLPVYERRSRLVWHKRRYCCPDETCPRLSWTEEDPRIGAPRMTMTDRAGRWVTEQVGRFARTVAEVARQLGCDWHTVNDTVGAHGEALVDDDPKPLWHSPRPQPRPGLFVRLGRFRRREFSTQIVDVVRGQLLDVVPGRSGKEPIAWLGSKSKSWRDGIAYATLDLSGPYRAVFHQMLPEAVQVADPFHVVRLASSKLDECRRRVQNATIGHRGHKPDPLYRCRRLLTKADERLEEHGREKLLGLLRAGDPEGEVTTA